MKKQACLLWGMFLCFSCSLALAQKKTEGYDKVVFGTYIVSDQDQKEYIVSAKSGEVLFTARMDKQYTSVGRIEKAFQKELFTYLNSKEWTDLIQFDKGKDYQYVRLYKDKEYVEMMWPLGEGNIQMKELFTKLTQRVEDFKLPEPVMVVQK